MLIYHSKFFSACCVLSANNMMVTNIDFAFKDFTIVTGETDIKQIITQINANKPT